MNTNIFKTIRDERADFLNNEIEVVPGYTFSQYNTLKKVHLYYNGHYEKGDYELINGVKRKKVFHNMSPWRCEIATKMIDMDVKDFTLVSNIPEHDLQVSILEKELKAWLKRSAMGKLLNEVSRTLPVYGTSVIKKTKDGAELVDLRYFYCDQTAKTLKDARYINIKHFLSHKEMRDMKGKWDDVDQAIEMFSGKYHQGYDMNGLNSNGNGSSLFFEGASQQSTSQNAPLVEVWERYGQVPLSWFTDKEADENEYVLAKYITTGIDTYQKNDKGVILAEDGIVLYKEQIKEIPFKEVHYNKTDGRWLGIGIVESLFESQRRMNELKNQEARALELGALQIYQTRDSLIQSNILTDLDNGDIIKVKSEITPLVTESREMVGFQNVAQMIDQHADNTTFSRDVVSGENAPSGATLGAIQIQTQQVTAVFDYKKENIGLFLNEFITDLVFPQIEKDINKEHILRLTGSFEEVQKLRSNFALNMANQEIIKAILDVESAPVTQELHDYYVEKYMTEISSMGDKIWVQVWANFFKNLDYEVDVITTGENKNVFANIQNNSQLMQLISGDPTIMQDPVKKKLLFKIMANMGYHQSELDELNTAQPAQQNVQQGIQNSQEMGQGGQAQPSLGGGQVQPQV